MKCIVEIFDNDRVNDHRMAIDIFNSLKIPSSEKAFIMLQSDTCGKELLIADHQVPEGTYRFGWDVNALDYYGVYRLIHALSEYAFTDNLAAKDIALNVENAEHRFMGKWWTGKPIRELVQSNTPVPGIAQTMFLNFKNHIQNPQAQNPNYFHGGKDSKVSSSITLRNYASVLHNTLAKR